MAITREIIVDLKGESNIAFQQLYKEYFGMVSRFVTKNNGSMEDAEDIFQESMMVLVEKLRLDHFQLTASIKTYIMAICKNLWLKRWRTSHRLTEFTELYNNQFFEEIDLAIDEEKSYWDKLQHYLTKITDHCNKLIHDMFFHHKSIEQIQKDYSYTTKHNAQNQKHKCMEQIKKVKELDEKKI